MGKRTVKAAAALLCAVLLAACSAPAPPEENSPTEPIPTEPAPAEPVWNGVWYVYWDAGAVGEISRMAQLPGKACAFSCLFDDTASVYRPDGLEALCGAVKALPGEHFLSVTNDVLHDDGTVTQKDPAILELLWDGGMEPAAEALLAEAREMGFDGLEVDFENIKEQSLWQRYSQFLSLLWQKAREAGLQLRVVLPCSMPPDTALPEGPDYSVMCYNLYGTHSGPGPKADIRFLRETAQKFREIPKMSYALASGGFLWNSAGRVERSVTEQEAVSICREFGAEVTRDQDSLAMTAVYRDGEETYTIWYADGVTLSAWQEAIRSAVGEDAMFDLWRAGGNLPIAGSTNAGINALTS